MPELPEVEVMAGNVHVWSCYKTITNVQVLRQNGKYHVDGIVGKKITDIQRRGKRLFFVLSDDLVLSVHNAMSGFWDTNVDLWTFDYVEGKRQSTEKDVRVEITTVSDASGEVKLRFHDQRLFGSMKVMTHDEVRAECAKMGPEAIKTKRMMYTAPVMNALDMAVVVGNDKRPIKAVLTDQSAIAGVGNIYAAESLWMSRIHPLTPANQLTTEQIAALTEAIQRALNGALERDLSYDGLLVYRRKQCSLGHAIAKVEVAKRQTYFCPECQKGN